MVSLLALLVLGTSVSTATQKWGHETRASDPKPVKISKKDVPKAKIAAESCTYTSNTYLHVCRATESAFDWVDYDCCTVLGREGYKRFNDNRVDIDVWAKRNGTSMCRWVIVRGSDVSRTTYYHPDKSWRYCNL